MQMDNERHRYLVWAHVSNPVVWTMALRVKKSNVFAWIKPDIITSEEMDQPQHSKATSNMEAFPTTPYLSIIN